MKKDRVIEIATYITVPFMFWIILPMVGLYLDSLMIPRPFAVPLVLLILGWVLIVVGMALALTTIYLFKTIGQGTPNPAVPPKIFVVVGPYRYCRNPMAFGGLLMLLGQAAVYYSPSLAGLSVVYYIAIIAYIVLHEEPVLKKRFGDPYIRYLNRVPRFFPIPFKRYG
jgi:protein-S-isoprenylcysteine O-methyltransferase Ste14